MLYFDCLICHFNFYSSKISTHCCLLVFFIKSMWQNLSRECELEPIHLTVTAIMTKGMHVVAKGAGKKIKKIKKRRAK